VSRRALLRAAPARLALFLALAPLLAAACGPSQERASDEQLRAAIERMRSDQSTHWTDRAMHVAEVEKIPALTPAGHDAKNACVDAYRKLSDAERTIEEAERDLKVSTVMGQPPGELEKQYVAKAEKQLQEAKKALPACDAAAAKLALGAR
jgi:sRNA-binding protein